MATQRHDAEAIVEAMSEDLEDLTYRTLELGVLLDATRDPQVFDVSLSREALEELRALYMKSLAYGKAVREARARLGL